MKTKKIIMVCFAVLCIVVLIILYINKDKTYVKKCYFDNDQTFDYFATYFSNSYETSLHRIEYNFDDNTMIKYYGEKSCLVNCDDEFIHSKLTELCYKYKNDSNGTIFSFVRACYDHSGNMLLYFVVKSNKNDNVFRNNYLVYIDESYNGHGSGLSIDMFNVSRKPISGNWCYWSADIPVG